MDLTDEDVTDILALLDSLPYDELDVQTPRFRLTLRRTPDGWTQAVESRSAPNVAPAAPAAAAAPPGPDPAPAAAPAPGSMEHRAGCNRPDGASSRLSSDASGADEAEGVTGTSFGGTGAGAGGQDARQVVGEADADLVAVRAPLPGTFYRAPRPGAAPFVEMGSRVGTDTVVGIVETMKLFNSVTAGAAGTVAEICLGNAEFADRGATLLRIRAD